MTEACNLVQFQVIPREWEYGYRTTALIIFQFNVRLAGLELLLRNQIIYILNIY